MQPNVLLPFAACLVLAVAPAPAFSQDWTQFRGPQALASSHESLPTRWSDSENLLWRTELPGPGTSSPITLGSKIYLTCYSGYGLVPNEGNMEDLLRHLVCLDRASGNISWTKQFAPVLPESAYKGGNDGNHGYSSATVATDGERLYLFFGKSGAYAVDLDGNELWHADLGSRTDGWGSGNSPILHKNLVIINASVESGCLVGLDKATGTEVWRSEKIVQSSWNTPVLLPVADGSTELVVSVKKFVLGFDPESGKELWRCEGVPTYACPTGVAKDGIVYITGGRGTQYTLAVRGGGRGDVTQSHRLWYVPKGSNVSSPVLHDGLVFVARDSEGILYAFDAANGDVVYESRIKPRPGLIYASPIVAGGKLYLFSRHDGAFVVEAKREYHLVAHNQFSEDHRLNASPVADGKRLLIRDDKYLHCIGEKGE